MSKEATMWAKRSMKAIEEGSMELSGDFEVNEDYSLNPGEADYSMEPGEDGTEESSLDMDQLPGMDPDMTEAGQSVDPSQIGLSSRASSRRHIVDDEASVASNNSNKKKEVKKDSLTDKIPRRTRRARGWTFALLGLLAVGTAVGSYLVTLQQSYEEVDEEFASVADVLFQGVETRWVSHQHALKGLANAYTAYALDRAQPWPEITLPSFAAQSDETRQAGNFDMVFMTPWVENRLAWEAYAQENHGEWIFQGLNTQGAPVTAEATAIPTQIYGSYDEDLLSSDSDGATIALPLWQMNPVDASLVNLDLLTLPRVRQAIAVLQANTTDFILSPGDNDWGQGLDAGTAFVLHSIRTQFVSTASIGGYVAGLLQWESFFSHLLSSQHAVQVKLTNTVDQQSIHLLVHGTVATHLEVIAKEDGPSSNGCVSEICRPFAGGYELCLYPDADSFHSEASILYIILASAAAVLVLLVVCVYDCILQRAQRQLVQSTSESLAVVSSLFPKDVHKRLLEKERDTGAADRSFITESGAPKRGLTRVRSSLSNFLADPSEVTESGGMDYLSKTKPIADLFPETSIMFGDLVGFTAWSSAREPTQVFRLLETIYFHFDELAKQRKVFKVETVGDCYVACCGLPTPNKAHAVVLARFARDCLMTFNRLVKQLEIELGPDTADLAMRFGLHSGQTTAGVLRGDRARFQLFGDTVNTTSRMESTGKPGMIHLSQQTADLLSEAGKGHWLQQREDTVTAKGKGEMTTYWLNVYSGPDPNGSGMGMERRHSTGWSETSWQSWTENDLADNTMPEVGGVLKRSFSSHVLLPEDATFTEVEKRTRLVEWCSDLLSGSLKAVIAHRQSRRKKPAKWKMVQELEQSFNDWDTMVMDEVVEVIELPSYVPAGRDPDTIILGDKVVQQLKAYVETLSFMYRDNAFHNWEHASHVTMSVNKLLSRIVAPDIALNGSGDLELKLHDHTYGITSDPLTQFALVLSALVHDVDHTGLPNSQLVKEQTPLATTYNNRSVAEQNSIDLAWGVLMEKQYTELRQAIYETKEELLRFRQLLVNAVLATDIMDKELKALRNRRWDKAFAEKAPSGVENDKNRKATIVMEHIIQASDVSHTMQHWQIYRKWNARLFEELHSAYVEGRAGADPATFWYQGELNFFDFYILPLARKLKDCGVFGVCSDEYLNYAVQNRAEWESKGQAIVAELKESVTGSKLRQGDSLKSMSLLSTRRGSGGGCSHQDMMKAGNSSRGDLMTIGNLSRRELARSGSSKRGDLVRSGSSKRGDLMKSAGGSRRSLLKSTSSTRSISSSQL